MSPASSVYDVAGVHDEPRRPSVNSIRAVPAAQSTEGLHELLRQPAGTVLGVDAAP